MDLKELGITPWFINSYQYLEEILKEIAIPYASLGDHPINPVVVSMDKNKKFNRGIWLYRVLQHC